MHGSKNLNLPKLDSASCEVLISELSPKEITDPIKSLQIGKSPGTDGLGIEFYKKFANQIAPLLHRMFSYSVTSEKLPPASYNANIASLLKQDRDETDPSLYPPISVKFRVQDFRQNICK